MFCVAAGWTRRIEPSLSTSLAISSESEAIAACTSGLFTSRVLSAELITFRALSGLTCGAPLPIGDAGAMAPRGL